MQFISPENLLISLLLIAPGFVAAYIFIVIGVIENEISNTKFVILCLVLSAIIDSLFLTLVELLGQSLTSPTGIQSIFFDNRFYPEYIALLGVITVVVGVGFSWMLIMDVPNTVRQAMWRHRDLRRNPWQPWEGVLRKATEERLAAQVLTSDDELVKGKVIEYSRAERSKELYLSDPHWFDEQIEDFVEGGSGVLLLEDDIVRLEVVEPTTVDSDSEE